MATQTKAEVQAELDALRVQHEALRTGVVEAAIRLKTEHDLCSEVEEVLSELGLELPRAEVLVTLRLDANEFAAKHSIDPTERDIKEQIEERLRDGWNGWTESLDVVKYEPVSA